jgi:hypothetical protein
MIISFMNIQSHNDDLHRTPIIIQAYKSINTNGMANLGVHAALITSIREILIFLCKRAKNIKMEI